MSKPAKELGVHCGSALIMLARLHYRALIIVIIVDSVHFLFDHYPHGVAGEMLKHGRVG